MSIKKKKTFEKTKNESQPGFIGFYRVTQVANQPGFAGFCSSWSFTLPGLVQLSGRLAGQVQI
jgi:hypothetical protein